VQTLRAFASSSAQEQVDDLLKKLQDLKEEFDRGVNLQMFETIDMNGEAFIAALVGLI
jgi:cyclopropane fatty-acyl-phospholipid synthase-like methyltransferase